MLTNPHDPIDLTETLLQALTMDSNDCERRQRNLFGIVCHYDLARWWKDFLEAAALSGLKANGNDAGLPQEALEALAN